MLVNDPKELEKIRERESDITRERIEKILAAGANVVLTTKGIDDMSLKYFVKAGAIAARRVPRDDLRHAVKCRILTVDCKARSALLSHVCCVSWRRLQQLTAVQAHCKSDWRVAGADAGGHGWQ